MANTIVGGYDPILYAQEAMSQLQNRLGLASRVHRGYDKADGQQGSTISIRQPADITAQAGPGSTATSLVTSQVNITLDKFYEAKFEVTDKEISGGGTRLMDDHIGRAMGALAQQIDSDIASLYVNVPWWEDAQGTTSKLDIINPRKTLFGLKNRVDDGLLYFMISGSLEANLLNLASITENAGGGVGGVQAQSTGRLPELFGVKMFATQNAPEHTKGTYSTSTLAVNALTAAGATTINLDAVSVTGTLVPGDVFTIAGHTQKYAVTNTVTASGNAFAGVTFTPGLAASAANDAAVTVESKNHTVNLMFHRNAFALAMAPLPEVGNGMGAVVRTVSEPDLGLSLRATLSYDPHYSRQTMKFDVLYGVKALDPNRAVRLRE